MSHDYDYIEMEHATVVAAAAFAISSHVLETSHEKKMSEFPETSLTKSRSKKVYDKNSSFSQLDEQGNNFPTTSPIREEKIPKNTISFTPAPSMKKTPTFSEKSKRTDDKKPDIPKHKKTPTFADEHFFDADDDTQPETPKPKMLPLVDDPNVSLRPPPPPPPPPAPQLPISHSRPPTRPSTTETKADSWEREELIKIKERYEKLLETIDSWEKRKKMKARRKLNKHEAIAQLLAIWVGTRNFLYLHISNVRHSENERKREKARRKYQDKIKYIDEIAAGARAQSDDRRKNETLKAKEKANTIRTTGKLPGACSCF
ncbi:hypothetical protein L195_g023845 [Trifolium pratense]|uniref:Remorin C-terminal domain-containing protein n=1 Tax=Trifolium pratense TaxID=57577 RepID=A0A2K3NBZ4_TRIPR|nr:hypothetical protein L195_g023845 [Trifolium pratense]